MASTFSAAVIIPGGCWQRGAAQLSQVEFPTLMSTMICQCWANACGRWAGSEAASLKCSVCDEFPANTKHLHNICTTSAQRLRRRSNIVQMFWCIGKCCLALRIRHPRDVINALFCT